MDDLKTKLKMLSEVACSMTAHLTEIQAQIAESALEEISPHQKADLTKEKHDRAESARALPSPPLLPCPLAAPPRLRSCATVPPFSDIP